MLLVGVFIVFVMVILKRLQHHGWRKRNYVEDSEIIVPSREDMDERLNYSRKVR